MSSLNYPALLSLAFPGAKWTLYDMSNFNSLEWLEGNAMSKPTHEDLMAKVMEIQPLEALRLLRLRRNELLQQTDMYALPDFPHPDEAIRNAWLAYRQALRDITKTASPQLDLTNLQLNEASVAWPSRPGQQTF